MLCIPRKPGHMRLIYMHSRDFMVWLEKVPLMSWYNQTISAKIQFQDYELLHGQQARLQQGAKAWHTPIQVDGLPKLYRDWLKKASSFKYSSDPSQDDYACKLTGEGPYFKGWRQCGGKGGSEDIEDLGHPCRQDCSVPSTDTLPKEIE